ncbi:MAG: metal ABC transporter ATP-binding protein [Oligoflexia bacterium]|nr:metal ABC transporter ATP-binding protein [Oligoflexia bacterium]
MTELVTIKNLSFSYHENMEVLKNLNLSIKEGEILGVLGPNGGGKSTLLKIIVGLISSYQGKVLYKGSLEKKNISMAYLPQKDSGHSSLPITVKELLRVPPFKASAEQISEALNQVDMLDKADRLVSELSGGEYQRVLLAKAVLNKPELIVLDEPTKGLDGKGQDQLLSLINKIKNDQKMAILMVDHNIQQVLKHCDRLLCLNKSFHWHDTKELVNKEILEHTYHCEFEHLAIHEMGGDILNHPHEHCTHDHSKDEK